jgi:S1-C subfamily serine protease
MGGTRLGEATVGDSDLVRVGDRVASIGNGRGLHIGAGRVTRVNLTTGGPSISLTPS